MPSRIVRPIAALLFFYLPASASAHVVFAEPQARAGAYYAGFLRVSHGCGASPTVSIRVDVPERLLSVRPQPKPGWALAIEKAPLVTPRKGEGGAQIMERVASVTWTGLLPVDQFDQFGLMMKLPPEAGPIYFPVVQRCQSAANEWTEVPADPSKWHDLKRPAPILIVQVSERDPHAGH